MRVKSGIIIIENVNRGAEQKRSIEAQHRCSEQRHSIEAQSRSAGLFPGSEGLGLNAKAK